MPSLRPASPRQRRLLRLLTPSSPPLPPWPPPSLPPPQPWQRLCPHPPRRPCRCGKTRHPRAHTAGRAARSLSKEQLAQGGPWLLTPGLVERGGFRLARAADSLVSGLPL
eukprot:5112608-Prymnesium_polylepis.2